jgi:hypothetical protein
LLLMLMHWILSYSNISFPGAMQGWRNLHSAKLQDVASCSQVVAEVDNKNTSGFGRHLFLQWVHAEISVCCWYKVGHGWHVMSLWVFSWYFSCNCSKHILWMCSSILENRNWHRSLMCSCSGCYITNMIFEQIRGWVLSAKPFFSWIGTLAWCAWAVAAVLGLPSMLSKKYGWFSDWSWAEPFCCLKNQLKPLVTGQELIFLCGGRIVS